jgi:hypothetical protein
VTPVNYCGPLRYSEIRYRAAGMYEQANAIRQLADEIDAGGRITDVVFDSGVFDRHGPPAEGEIPYLVQESPRLQVCACGAAAHYTPRLPLARLGSLQLRRNGRQVCQACFDVPEGGTR